MVGISKTEVRDSIALLLGETAKLGICQPDGTFVTNLTDLAQRLAEMAATGEAAVVDGLATRVQRPRSWANQKVLYDAKRHTHTAQGVAVSTIHGDLLWCDGGWPGSCHEHELLTLSGIDQVLDDTEVTTLVDRGFRGLAKARAHWHAPTGDRRTKDQRTTAERATTLARPGCAPWWSSRSGIWPLPGRPPGRGQAEPTPPGLGAGAVPRDRSLAAAAPPSLHGGVRLRARGAGADAAAAARAPAGPLPPGAAPPGRAWGRGRLFRPAAPRPRGPGHHGDHADQAAALPLTSDSYKTRPAWAGDDPAGCCQPGLPAWGFQPAKEQARC
jgi:DDE superfamily endonuclease